jgi:hypothetical protein
MLGHDVEPGVDVVGRELLEACGTEVGDDPLLDVHPQFGDRGRNQFAGAAGEEVAAGMLDGVLLARLDPVVEVVLEDLEFLADLLLAGTADFRPVA